MKMFPRRALRFVVVALSVGVAAAQESVPKSRMQQVQEEYEARRKLRESAQDGRGLAFAPVLHPEDWFAAPREINIEGTSLILCGQTFATLARKEVMISGRVAKRTITVSTSKVSREEALAAFRRALEAQGIAIIPIGEQILALVDKAEVP